jgi:hypothetical protein
MRTYKRVIVQAVRLGDITAWRVVGYDSKGKRTTIAYFPNEEAARGMKQVLMGQGQRTRQSKAPKRANGV